MVCVYVYSCEVYVCVCVVYSCICVHMIYIIWFGVYVYYVCFWFTVTSREYVGGGVWLLSGCVYVCVCICVIYRVWGYGWCACLYVCMCLCGLWLIPRCVWGCVCSSRLVQYATSELTGASHIFWPEKLKIITIWAFMEIYIGQLLRMVYCLRFALQVLESSTSSWFCSNYFTWQGDFGKQ